MLNAKVAWESGTGAEAEPGAGVEATVRATEVASIDRVYPEAARGLVAKVDS